MRAGFPADGPRSVMSSEYVLVLGSNHRRAAALRHALDALQRECAILACSGVMRTRDHDGGLPYLNAALRVRFDAAPSPERIRQRLREIEAAAGRVRGSGVCVLDIDLLAQWTDGGLGAVYKPQDLERDYTRPLLAALGLPAR